MIQKSFLQKSHSEFKKKKKQHVRIFENIKANLFQTFLYAFLEETNKLNVRIPQLFLYAFLTEFSSMCAFLVYRVTVFSTIFLILQDSESEHVAKRTH